MVEKLCFFEETHEENLLEIRFHQQAGGGENEKDAVAVPGEYDEYFHNVACSLGIVVAGVNLGQMLVINVPPSFKRN